MIKQMQYSPLQTEKDRVSEWGSSDARFLLYRKFLKSSEIVYNGLEIKDDMTKERRGLRHDVAYEVFCFDSGGTALSDDGETMLREWN